MREWRFSASRSLSLNRPRFIAILNITPDSFYEALRLADASQALAAAERFIAEGADMLDIGGESTRPGAEPVPAAEQVRRILPAIVAVRRASNVPISVDTTCAAVARAAVDAGADVINDISAGRDDQAMFPLAAERKAGLIIMHRLRAPRDDSYSDQYREDPKYTDVVQEISAFLGTRARAAITEGVDPASIVVDPGLGFGKTVQQNLELIRRTPELAASGFPVLSALSRKSFTGKAGGLETSAPADRFPATLALSIAHYHAGVRIFRVHDVAPHRQALAAADAALPL